MQLLLSPLKKKTQYSQICNNNQIDFNKKKEPFQTIQQNANSRAT